jgi:glutathione S-transferase
LPRNLRRDARGIQQPAIRAADEPQGSHPGFKIWAGAQADIDRIATIWRECLARAQGPYLFGALSMADAMYAPVVTRFLTYDVRLDRECAAYGGRIMALPDMVEWVEAAKAEPDALEELDVEF